MKTKIYVLFLLISALVQSQTTLPKVENHLKGELDYTHEALELVESQPNGEEISLGKINTDGTINFNLPEFDLRALYKSINSEPYSLLGHFSLDHCKDKDAFAETPHDDVYTKKYVLYVKKYGMNLAVLEVASDSLAPNSNYSWFYLDRAISLKEECIKTSYTGDVEAKINANIEFEKGWNFIYENNEWVQTNSQGDSLATGFRKTHFTKISPVNKKVKWSLRQIHDDEKIQTAKRLYNLTPIAKKQFEKWAPNTLGDLKVTTKEHGNPPQGQKNKNNMHLIYANKTEKKEIDLYVIDCAKNPDDLEMINFAYAMENKGKDEKDIKPYVAQYSERKKATQLLYKVENRLFVNASGVNINAEDLWDYIKKLKVEKLLKK